jgi:serine/threonine-protein kinase
MATPLPAKTPGTSDSEVDGGDRRGVLPSRTSTKLEPPDPQFTTLEPGTIIAERYRVDSLLGEGGMGKVYAAEHVHMRKQVAIKVLHPEMSTTPEVVARFEREAVAAGKIAHPNVAAATDFGRLEDRSFFLVLEYVAGVDLRAVLRRGAVSPERAVHILRQITSAVGAAHAAGIVHRDLKPENVMLVDRDGDPDFVKVLDFGIAKIDAIGMNDTASTSSASGPSSAQPLTKMGAVFGTPDYMSPEQALGQTIDARSDLYSIGVMFYELLTGERPFKGGAVTLMRKQVLEDPPTLPPKTMDSVGAEYDAVIQKLLKKSAQERYASAPELLQVLDELDRQRSSGTAKTAYSSVVVGSPAALAQTSPDGLLGEARGPAVRRKRPRYGLASLAIVTFGVGALYLYDIPPKALLRDMWTRAFLGQRGSDLFAHASGGEPVVSATALPSPSVPSPSASIPSPSSSPSSDLAAASASDSAQPSGVPPADSDETNASPSADDPEHVTASAAPHHLGPHVTQAHPGSKPMHKANKSPSPAPKHNFPSIPPPSQWFKN